MVRKTSDSFETPITVYFVFLLKVEHKLNVYFTTDILELYFFPYRQIGRRLILIARCSTEGSNPNDVESFIKVETFVVELLNKSRGASEKSCWIRESRGWDPVRLLMGFASTLLA